ncbi:MAG: hypothetical protein HW416_1346, partial [Chloroflexi bacterium]|nr:hypothetical protein [Chloroflexota bacterium]
LTQLGLLRRDQGRLSEALDLLGSVLGIARTYDMQVASQIEEHLGRLRDEMGAEASPPTRSPPSRGRE